MSDFTSKIISFDIGGRNMAMSYLEVTTPIVPNKKLRPMIDFVPKFTILKFDRTDVGIIRRSTLSSRGVALRNYLDEVIPKDAIPDQITIERQYVASREKGMRFDPNYDENSIAESIMHIMLGILIQRYPNAYVHVVVPMLAKQRIEGSQYMKKQQMLRKGLDTIRANSTEWFKYVISEETQTDICEAFMMGIAATPVITRRQLKQKESK